LTSCHAARFLGEEVAHFPVQHYTFSVVSFARSYLHKLTSNVVRTNYPSLSCPPKAALVCVGRRFVSQPPRLLSRGTVESSAAQRSALRALLFLRPIRIVEFTLSTLWAKTEVAFEQPGTADCQPKDECTSEKQTDQQGFCDAMSMLVRPGMVSRPACALTTESTAVANARAASQGAKR